MKAYHVFWWNGDEIVEANDEAEAKHVVATSSTNYLANGRKAPLFCEEALVNV